MTNNRLLFGLSGFTEKKSVRQNEIREKTDTDNL